MILHNYIGLDPAGPYFEDMDTIVRLDTTDADFVDVIHTDTDPIYTLGRSETTGVSIRYNASDDDRGDGHGGNDVDNGADGGDGGGCGGDIILRLK